MSTGTRINKSPLRPLLVRQHSGFHRLCTHAMSVKAVEKERPPNKPLPDQQQSGFQHLCTHSMSAKVVEKERSLVRPLPAQQQCRFQHLCTHAMSVKVVEKGRPLMGCWMSQRDFVKKAVRWADGQSATGLCGHVGNLVRGCPNVHKPDQACGWPWLLPGGPRAELSWVVRGKSKGLVPSTLYRCTRDKAGAAKQLLDLSIEHIWTNGAGASVLTPSMSS